MTDTIVALSSGSPPAAIAVIRVSGPEVRAVATAVVGGVPRPRRATLREVRASTGELLDRALVLFFPAPRTATGDDILELHCHGGRAVVAAVLAAIREVPGVRNAEAGEFTRRALENGIVDVDQVEGLADLLAAETETQRRAALAASEGSVGRMLRGWSGELAAIRALVEATIDLSDEDDVTAVDSRPAIDQRLRALAIDVHDVLAKPTLDRLRDGPLIVLAGPPNAGKSSLFNALLDRDAAIVTAQPGTTRDVLEASVIREGRPYRLADTAGLALATVDPIERIGIERARQLASVADVLLWLGEPRDAPPNGLLVHARADERKNVPVPANSIATSIFDRTSIEALWTAILAHDTVTSATAHLRVWQRELVTEAVVAIEKAVGAGDELILADELRLAASKFARAIGDDPTEAMLSALFSRFCVGK